MAISHVNFGLRSKESELDQAFLEDLALSAGVPIFTHSVSPGSQPASQIQAWARRVRYEEFRRLAAEGWLVALAHHADDLAENVLLRLARGTSPAAMAGMSAWNPPFWRPLLSSTRKDLAGWARRHNVPHREDASNAKMDYSRNVVRHRILPELEALFPGARRRLVRCAEEAAELAAFAAEELGAELAKAKTSEGLALDWLLGRPQAVAFQALARLIGPLPEGRRRLTHRFLSRLWSKLAATQAGATWVMELPAGAGYLELAQGRLLMRGQRREPVRVQKSQASLRTSLYPDDWRFLLEEGTELEIHSPAPREKVPKGRQIHRSCKSLVVENSSLPTSQFRVYLPKAAERLRFIGGSRPWQFKELVRLADIPLQQRRSCLVLQELRGCDGGKPPTCLGILVGGSLRIPDEEGKLNEGKFTVKCHKFNYDG